MDTHLSSLSTFEVGKYVHSCSWGERVGITNRTTSKSSTKWTTKDFQIIDWVGQGHFGDVSRALYMRQSSHKSKDALDTVALKSFSKPKVKQGCRSLELLRREVNTQSHLCHKNILPLLGFFEDETSLQLVLEFAPRGDLISYMRMATASDNEGIDATESVFHKNRLKVSRNVLRQVCQALDYIEDMQICHRDLKLENVVVTADHTMKLCDFGWAVRWKLNHFHSTLCGTAEYCPPEMLTNKISYAPLYVDRWMLGVLALELVHDTTPFCPPSDFTYNENDPSGKHYIFNEIRAFSAIEALDNGSIHPDPDYRNFVASLMQVRPRDRLSPCAALDHRFFLPLAVTRRRRPQVQSVARRRKVIRQAYSGGTY